MQTQINTEKRINNLKSLAGSIAHETRSPLSAIKSASDLIKDNLNEISQYVDLISISSNRGLMIVEMILAAIREEKINSNNFKKLSMVKIVNKAIREYGYSSEEERELVSVSLREDFYFKGDETLMIFVIFNLMKNALYYKAKIDIWINKTDDGNYLHFQDYGVGIENDKIDKIFDNFFTSDKVGGTGLGLPFCKRIIEAFGGEITCESIKGQVTSFTMKF